MATLRHDISHGAENTKTFEDRRVGRLHQDHKDNVGMSMLYSKRLPNRAFAIITKFLDQPHLRSIRQMKKRYELKKNSISQSDMDEAKRLYKRLKLLP